MCASNVIRVKGEYAIEKCSYLIRNKRVVDALVRMLSEARLAWSIMNLEIEMRLFWRHWVGRSLV